MEHERIMMAQGRIKIHVRIFEAWGRIFSGSGKIVGGTEKYYWL